MLDYLQKMPRNNFSNFLPFFRIIHGFLFDLPDIGAGGFEGADDPDDSGLMKPEFEDWSLVLTTSRGQVKIAPIVPPVLQ